MPRTWAQAKWIPMVQQPDAVLSQVNPVSTTLYPVLDTTTNVRIYSVALRITWAVTQPTLLEAVLTIDGNSIIHGIGNPVSAVPYGIFTEIGNQFGASSGQYLIADYTAAKVPIFYEGRSVKVEARITWAVTQPTPLECRVKWGRYLP